MIGKMRVNYTEVHGKQALFPLPGRFFKHLKPMGKAFLGMLYNFLEYSSHSHARLTLTSQTLETRALLV